MVWKLVVLLSISVTWAYNYYPGDQRIYSFAFTGLQPGAFFDGQKLTGARVELMKEVCCLAGKRCVGALVPFNKCMDTDFLSPVLDNRWHDVCNGLANSPRRAAAFAFSNITFWTLSGMALIKRAGSNITLNDLRNPRNKIRVAVNSAPELVTIVGLERFKKEFFVQPENIDFFNSSDVNKGVDAILEAVNDPCNGGNAETVGIVDFEMIRPNTSFELLKLLGPSLGGITQMVRKDSQHILEWWDFHLKQFMCSPKYADFCDRLDMQFGPNPINCPDPNQVNCSECFFPRREPFCDCPLNLS